MSDLESRIKAIEEKLNPSPDKMSTMKASNKLKQMLDDKKGGKETQEDVVWRLNEQAERVPELEKENSELRATKWELEKDKGLLLQDVVKLKMNIKELENKLNLGKS